MEQRFESEELDQETLEYLQKAVKYQGHGMPGIYLNSSQAHLPAAYVHIVAVICGPIIMLVTLGFTWGSLANPVGTALFQTAGFFLGGWMIVAFVRCLLARARSDYLGYFKFVDPLFIWHGTGRGVDVTSLSMLLGAEVRNTHNETGNYKSSTLRIDLADRTVSMEVRSESKGEQLEEFLNALVDIRTGSPTERGYAALERVQSLDGDDDMDEDGQIVETIPEPRRVRSARGWLLTALLLPIAAIGVFMISYQLAVVLRDDATYEAVKGKPAPNLRFYLIDRRNTRHREAVIGELGRHHELAATQVLNNGREAELQHGLADIIRELKSDPRPVVTVWFKRGEKGPEVPAGYLSDEHLQTIDRDMIRDFSQRMDGVVGTGMVDFGEVTEGPARMEVVSKVVPGKANEPWRLEWTVTLKAKPLAEDGATRTVRMQTSLTPAQGAKPADTVRGMYRAFSVELSKRIGPPMP